MKRILSLLTALFLLAALTACGAEKVDKSLLPVRLGSITKQFTDSVGIAQRQGFFAEELAKVGYRPVFSAFAQAGPALNEALATDNIDFGIYGDFPQLVLFDKGVDVRAIAPATTAQNYGILVQPNSGIKTIKDLEGKRVIAPKGTVLQMVFESLLAREGVDAGKITRLNAMADAQSVFITGEADAVISTAFGIAVLQAQCGGDVIFSTENEPEWSTVTTVVGRGAFLDANPEAAKAVVRALFRAWEFAAADAEQAYQALSFEFAPPALIKAVYGYDPSFAHFAPEFTPEALVKLEATNAFLAANKLIAQKVDLNKFIDTQYIEAVRGEFA
ncbi:MAG: ABC transporter substrate-binding protein [Oscillospiraceae bacterium]|jgi:sulfonate transport system substrate-binding protein|nr:ABC transporter substrate-binding protein [Oscillospiraceae bacterium]